MNEKDKRLIREKLVWKRNLILWKSSGERVPRVAPGYIRLNGKVWQSREVLAVLLADKTVDRRHSESFNLARNFPEMTISRGDARALGLTIYRTGKPCLNGHTSWRFVSSGACVACRGLWR